MAGVRTAVRASGSAREGLFGGGQDTLNMVFTLLYTAEMLLALFAKGPAGFLRSGSRPRPAPARPGREAPGRGGRAGGRE